MSEDIKDSIFENFATLIQIRDFNQFVLQFPEVLTSGNIYDLSYSRIIRLVKQFIAYNNDNNWRINQRRLIYCIFSTIENIENRLLFYQDILKAIKIETKDVKDLFLVDILSIEQSTEIARFVYMLSTPSGEAYYHAVFFFLTGSCISPYEEEPQVEPPPVELSIPLKSPKIKFSDEQTIQFTIPEQRFSKDVMDLDIEGITLINSEPHRISLEKSLNGDEIITSEYVGNLPVAEGNFQISIDVNKKTQHTWEFQGITSDRPFMAFKDPSQNLSNEDILPRVRTWIVSQYPIIQEEGILQKGVLSGEWISYHYYLINPHPNRDYHLQYPEGSQFRIPFDTSISYPFLIGTKIDEVTFDPLIPWYSSTPILSIPYTYESENQQIIFEIFKSEDMLISLEKIIIKPHTEQEYTHRDENARTYKIDLAHHDLLGLSAAGEYTIKFLKTGEIIEFGVAPGLEILFHPPIACISDSHRLSQEIEINGPDSIEFISPHTQIRQGLYKISLDANFDALKEKRIEFHIFFDSNKKLATSSIKLGIKVPIIRYYFEDLAKLQAIFTDGDIDLLLKEYVTESIENGKIAVEKPSEVRGSWQLCIGTQESKKYSIDDYGNLSFPLFPFREMLLEQDEKELPVILSYLSKGRTTEISLFSLIDWTLEYQSTTIGFEDDCYTIDVGWRERGRIKKAYLTLFSDESGKVTEDVPFNPSKYRWRDYRTDLSVPFSVPEGVYTLGFFFNETDSEGWTPGPSVRYPLKIVLKRDPYAIAEWHLSRGEYDECLSWIGKIPNDDSKYPDALHIKAKCTGFIAESQPDRGDRIKKIHDAIHYVDQAIATNNTDFQYLITKAHLHNRIGFYDNENTEHYKNVKKILIPVLSQEPHVTAAIAEYGISLMALRNVMEAGKIYQSLRYLDPKDEHPAAIWGKSMLHFLYTTKIKGTLGQHDIKTIQGLLDKAKKLDEKNPLYQSLSDEMLTVIERVQQQTQSNSVNKETAA